jgi:hypothetical protein
MKMQSQFKNSLDVYANIVVYTQFVIDNYIMDYVKIKKKCSKKSTFHAQNVYIIVV